MQQVKGKQVQGLRELVTVYRECKAGEVPGGAVVFNKDGTRFAIKAAAASEKSGLPDPVFPVTGGICPWEGGFVRWIGRNPGCVPARAARKSDGSGICEPGNLPVYGYGKKFQTTSNWSYRQERLLKTAAFRLRAAY